MEKLRRGVREKERGRRIYISELDTCTEHDSPVRMVVGWVGIIVKNDLGIHGFPIRNKV